MEIPHLGIASTGGNASKKEEEEEDVSGQHEKACKLKEGYTRESKNVQDRAFVSVKIRYN